MPNNTLQHVVILMAMQGEASPFIEHFQMPEHSSGLSPALPFRCFQKTIGGIKVSLLTSGLDKQHQVDNIGCEPATLMAHEAINKLAPDLLISAGTAGGFSAKGAQIGTVYASEKYFIFHDRLVPMPGFDQAGEGCYPSLNVNQLAADLKLETGIVSSGSSLEKNVKDARVIDKHSAVAKEMEAAAIAWVANLYGAPFFALKSITNLVDEDNQSETEFVKHFDVAVAQLTEKLISVVDYLQHKTLSDLSN